MQFHVLTLFPEVFDAYLSVSLIGKAKESGIINVDLVQIRDFTQDKHKTVDDTPYGGGPGMVMKIEPIDRALQSLNIRDSGAKNRKIVVLAARGQQFTQAKAKEYSLLDELTLICGRYEGIDQRVVDHLADGELSIGPYVLAGGEAAAMVVIEAVARLLPGVLGNPDSLTEESFAKLKIENCKIGIEYPQYTTPADYRGWKVPKVLLSGNHAAIKKWREEQSQKRRSA
ncbi:MAG: tRNA (guanosine(37)-N1)-methyltransferase TrmD [bacterium]|nr:tRNA (guanosine(37)-N1)-methyltransferase TrmD [bacterium]MDZ4343287.1 tRNA (guanosine(37)-N1)-methyltransferase TrmD [Candidatus Binatia bacterium]